MFPVCWRWLIVLALLLGGQGTAMAASPPQDDVRQAWQLLDYIAADYSGAVRDGKVLSASEYAEMREFAASAREHIHTLPDTSNHAALLAAADALVQRIGLRAPAPDVANAAHALANDLLATYGLPTVLAKVPNLQRGAQLYTDQCAACHGRSGNGDGANAASMDPPPVAFSDAERAARRSPLALYEAITHGVPRTAMPAFASLSDADRWALAFHVGSLAYGQGDRTSGEKVWRNTPKLHDALPSLEALSRSSQVQLEQWLDAGQARAITAYLRTHPQAVTADANKGGSLAFAKARLQASLQAYRDGDHVRAKTLALSAYLDGVEPVEPMLAARDPALLHAIEAAMASVRAGIGEGAAPVQVAAAADRADALFDQADALLQESRSDAAADFLGSFTILVREGLEALLIVIGMIAFLRRAERREALPWVHAGWSSALLAGAATWVAATWLVRISGAHRELTEGLSSLFAALVLLSVGIWMHRKSMAGRWQQYLHAKVSAAAGRRSMWFLFLFAFVAVYREVFETILFYAAMWNPDSASAILAGLLAGAAVLALVAFALLRLGMRLPIGKFFAASSLLIALLAVVLAGKGVTALQEAGWIGLGLVRAPHIDWLGISPTWQSLLAQLVVLLVAVYGYLANARGARGHDAPA